MILKLDINIFKYIIITFILNVVISNIPNEKLLLNNKLITLLSILSIFILIDQSYYENFTEIISSKEHFANNTENSLITVKQPVFENKDPEEVPKISVQEQKQDLETPLINIINQSNANAINQTTDNVLTQTSITQPSNVINSQQPPIVKNSLVSANEDMGTTALPSKNTIIEQTISQNKAESCNCEDIANKAISKFLSNRRLLDNKGLLHYADAYIGDMGYSDLRYENYIPVGSEGDGVYNSWDMGKYALINTSRWRPTQKNEGRCRTDTPYDPQPLDKGQMNLMNWDYERKVMGPDNINVDYINDKLNSHRLQKHRQI
jgi:hypothetical protein